MTSFQTMPDQIIIHTMQFEARIGVTPDERRDSQPIGVDLELNYPDQAAHAVAEAEDLSKAIDYARVVERIEQTGRAQEFVLLETLADRLCRMLFAEFPIVGARVWVRKLKPPVKGVGSVGVRLERSRAVQTSVPKPAAFLLEQSHRLAKDDVLDVAAGHGRHTLYLAAKGFPVVALDRDGKALEELATRAREGNFLHVTTRTIDLEQDLDDEHALPKERYGTVLVFYYLHRPIFPALLNALKPGGILVYETFLIDQHLRFHHPQRREFCLAHNELLRLAAGLRILHYDEGPRESEQGEHGTGRAFTARLLAQKE